MISDDVGLCIDFLQPKEVESWQRHTAVSSSIFAFVVHSAQLVQWILHNLKSTQLPPDYDKKSMIENYTKKIKTHRRAHRFAIPAEIPSSSIFHRSDGAWPRALRFQHVLFPLLLASPGPNGGGGGGLPFLRRLRNVA